MADFDTSGYVWQPPGAKSIYKVRWEDLSPFEQGYVQALLRGVDLVGQWLDTVDPYRAPGFSDLAPEALAMILRDCEARAPAYAASMRYPPSAGRSFWRVRQHGHVPTFPPLRVFLNDAGKVCLASSGDR
ncbi:hypothetical protein [Phenylobacterium koreense]|uniref:Uncharacterized protein n=1 Tax=Phenylobacterium koreense TaxID=266125 RepID=A0ABV2EJP4_9CAUL